MICIESHERQEKRIDAMLQEMVVEEGLAAFEGNRELKVYTLQEMADYIGVGYKTLWAIEKSALNKFKKNMLELGIKNGNTGI